MTDLLRNLDVLESCGGAVMGLERQLESIPIAIAEIEARLEQFREATLAARASLEEAEQERRSAEGQLQDLQVQRAKFESQTALVKTNHEYTALLSEIDTATQRIAETEDKILMLMEQIDAETSSLEAVEREERHATAELGKEIDERQRELQEARASLELRRGEREVLVERLPSEARLLYDRVLTRHADPVARIQRSCCGACRFSVPFETVNRLMQGDLHVCPHCARILVAVEA